MSTLASAAAYDIGRIQNNRWQSSAISLRWQDDKKKEKWPEVEVNKWKSISAALTSVHFDRQSSSFTKGCFNPSLIGNMVDLLAAL